MKLVLLLSAFTVIFAEGFAQDSVRIQQRELDSLSRRILSNSRKDSVRVKILNEYDDVKQNLEKILHHGNA
jgi:hypothetical protein